MKIKGLKKLLIGATFFVFLNPDLWSQEKTNIEKIGEVYEQQIRKEFTDLKTETKYDSINDVPEDVLPLYLKAIKNYEEINWNLSAARLCEEIGDIDRELKNLVKAGEIDRAVSRSIEEGQLEKGVRIYEAAGRYDDAVALCMKYGLTKEIIDVPVERSNMDDILAYFKEKGDFESGIKFCEERRLYAKGGKIAEEKGDNEKRKGDYENAYNFYNKSINLYQKILLTDDAVRVAKKMRDVKRAQRLYEMTFRYNAAIEKVARYYGDIKRGDFEVKKR